MCIIILLAFRIRQLLSSHSTEQNTVVHNFILCLMYVTPLNLQCDIMPFERLLDSFTISLANNRFTFCRMSRSVSACFGGATAATAAAAAVTQQASQTVSQWHPVQLK